MKLLIVLLVAVACSRQVETRRGVILSFEGAGSNEELQEVIYKEADIDAYYRNGEVVDTSDGKLSLFRVSMEQHCYESSSYRLTAPGHCADGTFTVLRLHYGDSVLECLRVASTSVDTAVASIRPVVLRRFYLKVYYLMRSGECYYKYFSLPEYECEPEGHRKLARGKCEKLFPSVNRHNYD